MEDNKYENISTKVSAESKRQLDRILERMGMNYYQWFQLMAEVTIRISDDRHNLSEQMAKMIQMFQLVPGWKDPCTFCDPTSPAEIRAAVYLIQQENRKGLKPVLVERGWFDGIWKQTENVQDIIEFMLNQCMPTSYKWLRQHMTELGCNRFFEYLLRMADDAIHAKFDDEIAQMFGDNQRHDFGQEIVYGNKYVRKQHRTPDSLANSQQYIIFDDDDRELADYEAKEWEGEHRQTDFEPPAGGDIADEVENAIGGKPFDVEP